MQSIQPNRRRKIRTWSLGQQNATLQSIPIRDQSIKFIDLASNDYLGLLRHPNLIQAAHAAMYSDGVGAGSSRLITGTRPIHQELEEALADWLGRERVLLFPSGFQANLAAVIALADRQTTVFADRLIHHSLLIGVKASGAKLKRFAHNDLIDLKKRLKLCKNQTSKSPLVITESLFSMEGTSPKLKELTELCAQFGANLLVDEAHALGVLGEEGRGLCYGLDAPVSIISGTFGKAFGSGGAFLASNAILGEHLLQTSGAFRYTTALAPPLTAAALAALKLIKANPSWGAELQEHAKNWRTQLELNGWQRPLGHGPILPLVIGSDHEALDLQNHLEDSGILSVAIRPPTVPEKTARLRIVIRRGLPNETLNVLLNALISK